MKYLVSAPIFVIHHFSMGLGLLAGLIRKLQCIGCNKVRKLSSHHTHINYR